MAEVKVKYRLTRTPTVVDGTGVEFSCGGLGRCVLKEWLLTARPTGDMDDGQHGVGRPPRGGTVDQFTRRLVIETTPQVDAEYEQTLRWRVTNLQATQITFTHIRQCKVLAFVYFLTIISPASYK